MVGAIDQEQEEEYGKILAPYLERDDTLFVISSDFCHWYVCAFSDVDVWCISDKMIYLGVILTMDTRFITLNRFLARNRAFIYAVVVRALLLRNLSTPLFQILTTKLWTS
jgi:predicted class III extradiol MEMO1 family dioxygenase